MENKEDIYEEIIDTIANLENSGKLKNLVEEALSKGYPVEEISENGLKKGLKIVGDKYESGEYFLAELSFGGDLVTEAMEILEPHLEGSEVERKGTIVIGTVEGDIHDIGKNIVKMLMKCRGWEVIDLGVDVPPSEFAEAVKANNPDLLGMTSLLTTTTPKFGETIEKLEEQEIRDDVKIVLGGRSASEEIMTQVGAEAYAVDVESGIKKCEELILNDDA